MATWRRYPSSLEDASALIWTREGMLRISLYDTRKAFLCEFLVCWAGSARRCWRLTKRSRSRSRSLTY